MSILKSALAGALLFCAVAGTIAGACAYPDYARVMAGLPAHAEEVKAAEPETIRITFSPGGSIVDFIEDFTAHRNKGDHYIIDGMCISACTLILGLVPADHICTTPYAKFAFHSAALINPVTGERKFASEGTRLAWHIYPENVRTLLKTKHHWDGEDPKRAEHPNLIYIEGDELLTLIAPCKENTK